MPTQPPEHSNRSWTPGPRGVPTHATLLFGGDYNPEQWPRSVWPQDIALMQRAGINTVTVGVFSWAMLEPTQDRFETDWLDEVFELLHAADISVLLATPTASPPPWFSAAHPDALPIGPDGVRRWHGSRDSYCMSAPAYRAAARRITRLLAQHYGQHPALRGWHLHNEYGTLCYCDHVASAFQGWLRQRYGSLETLNDAWGTAFWSQCYSAWTDVLPPRSTQYLANPTQSIDFRRFASDELLNCLIEQRQEILNAGSTAPVTSNFMLPTWNHLEQWSWAAQEDFVSLDHYLDATGHEGEAHVAYAGDLARSWAGGSPWLLMEQSTAISVEGRSTPKSADRIVRNSLSYIARGSQGALFFQWRASTAGAEAWHGALLPHAGAASATFGAAEQLGQVLGRLGEVAEPPAQGRVVEADIAVLWHADGWWALENAGLPSIDLHYSDAVRDVHRALHQLGHAVDFAAPGADLGDYRMVIVPSMYGMDDATVAALERYVRRQGGHLVVGCFSGVSDATLRVVTGGYPGRLRDLLGIRVSDIYPLRPDQQLTLSDRTHARVWSERVELRGAEVLTRFSEGLLRGLPAVTQMTHPATEQGKSGFAIYMSTRLSDRDLERFLRDVAQKAGARPVVVERAPQDVEVVRRRSRSGDYLFMLNHSADAYAICGPGVDILTGSAANGALLRSHEYMVLRLDPGTPWPLDVRFQRPKAPDRHRRSSRR